MHNIYYNTMQTRINKYQIQICFKHVLVMQVCVHIKYGSVLRQKAERKKRKLIVLGIYLIATVAVTLQRKYIQKKVNDYIQNTHIR